MGRILPEYETVIHNKMKNRNIYHNQHRLGYIRLNGSNYISISTQSRYNLLRVTFPGQCTVNTYSMKCSR